jgi:hypothetical protein
LIESIDRIIHVDDQLPRHGISSSIRIFALANFSQPCKCVRIVVFGKLSQPRPVVAPVHATPCRSAHDGECGYTDYRRQIPSRFLCNCITTVVYVPSYLYKLSSVSRKLVTVPAGGLLHPEEAEPLTAKAKVPRRTEPTTINKFRRTNPTFRPLGTGREAAK